jgi:plasmid stabilization system protein ParE
MAEIEITPEAESDILHACRWYNFQKQGLGGEFLDEFVSCIERVEVNPSAFHSVRKNIRRALLRRFPYCLFYISTRDRIVLLACLHGSRAPSAWTERL